MERRGLLRGREQAGHAGHPAPAGIQGALQVSRLDLRTSTERTAAAKPLH